MTAPPEVLVELRGVSLRRGRTPILAGINWTIREGENWLLFGPNGCGKTMLLKIVTGYEWVSGGTVTLFGDRFGAGANIPRLRREIGWVSSALGQAMHAELTALEAAATGFDAAMRAFRDFTAEELEAAGAALDRFGIGHLAEREYGKASQGEKQRILVARALVHQPRLLILDEACAGMDPGARAAFLDDLSAFMAKPDAPAVVFVTHHIEEIGPFLSRALVLEGGRSKACGPIAEVITSAALSELFGRPFTVRHTGGRFDLLQGRDGEHAR